jgi:glycine cleavage system aminomethyltransferase T
MAFGPTIGKTIMLAYLPHERAVKGARFEIEYFGDRYPVEVAGVGYAPLYDPENLKPRS